MTSFTGVAGKNDNRAIGFDVWTKLTRTRAYRERQMEEKRGGKFGKAQSVNGIKRIAVTFVEGARDVYGRPIYEIIQGGQGSKINIDGTPVKNWVSRFTFDRDENGDVRYNDDGTPKIKRNKQGLKIWHRDENGQQAADVAPIRQPLQFNADIQRQFVPNHIDTAVKVFSFILDDVEFKFPEMVTGYDALGAPIIDHDKLDKMKEGIEHDVRYVLSTWPEIDYSARIVTWEAGRGGSDKPERGAKSVEISILESMFSAEALKFIQAEIVARGLGAKDEKDKEKRIKVKDDKGNVVEVDLCRAHDDTFRIAVWKGVFEYLIAKEIEAHRTLGSGYKRYDAMDLRKTADVLVKGKVLVPSEIKEIQKDTKTGTYRIISQWLSMTAAKGLASGFFASLRTFFKTLTAP